MNNFKKHALDVIIPAYNAERWISRCLDSLIYDINECKNDVNIIVINDGSYDCTNKLLNKYIESFDFIKVYTIDNSGVSVARNLGLDRSSGLWVTFVDADDFVLAGYIKKILNDISCYHNYDCLIYNYLRFYNCNDCVSNENFPLAFHSSSDAVFNLLEGKISNAPFAKVFKRESIGSLRFPPGITVGEDLLFLFKYLKKIEKVKVSDSAHYAYVINSGGVTGSSMTSKKIDDIGSVVSEIVESDFLINDSILKNKFIYNQFLSYLFNRKFLYFFNSKKIGKLFSKAVLMLKFSDVVGLKKKIALGILKILYIRKCFESSIS